jgi:uncharacterized membrane protein
MTVLIIGLALWISAHYFKRLMPTRRAAMGDKGKGPVALALVLGLILMVLGYRAAAFIPVWTPPSFFGHINNLLMLVAFFVWSVAHLLANGDLASIILFGGMLAWAIGSVVLINRAEEWVRPEPGDAKKDVLLVVITLVTFVVAAGIHVALGVNPFGGV